MRFTKDSCLAKPLESYAVYYASIKLGMIQTQLALSLHFLNSLHYVLSFYASPVYGRFRLTKSSGQYLEDNQS